MGNAVTNPGRFFEKKVHHEHLGMKDPLFPNAAAPPANCSGDWQRQDAELRVDRGVGQANGAGGSDLSTAISQSKIASSFGRCNDVHAR